MPPTASLFVQSIKHAVSEEQSAQQSDRELLDRFVAGQDQAAFAALLKRHSALVFGVCHRILRDRDLAEDAFQAVFIILSKKASSIRKRDALPGWLFGVARRIACQARRRRNRDRAHILQAADARRQSSQHDLRWHEMLELLEQELARLPRCYQAPLVACYLEGRTQDEAARELGWPLGTLRRRLDKGREMLKARLVRQGIAWSAGVMALGLWAGAVEAVGVELRRRALQAILSYGKGEAISQGVAIMVQGGLHWAAGSTWKALAAATIVGCSVGLGAIWSLAQAPPTPPEEEAAHAAAIQDAQREPPAPQPKWRNESLPEGAIARLGTLRFNHGDGLTSLHYTPDGKTIISYGGGFIRLWNAESGDEVKQFTTTKPGLSEQTVLLADGRTLLSTDPRFDKLRFWDVLEGKETRTIDLRGGGGILSLDGQLAAVHSQPGVDVYDTADGRLRFQTNKRGDMVRAVIFSGDSKNLIQADKGGVIEVWDAATGKPLKIFDQNPPAVVLAVSRDGRWLATLEHHNYAIDKHLDKDILHVWDLHRAKEIHKFPAKGWFMRLHFTPDSKRILAYASTEKGYSSHCWDLDTGAEMSKPPALGRATAFHPDAKRFVTGGGTRFTQWDLATGKQISSEISRYARANAVSFDATGDRIVTVGYDAFSDWAATTGQRLRSFDVPLYQYYDPRPILSVDGKLALTYQHGSKPYSIDMLLWDVASGKKTVFPLGDPPSRYVNAQHHINPCFTPDGKQLIVWQPGADKLSTIRVWDLTVGKETKQIPQTIAGGWRNNTLLADGKTLVVADQQAVGIDVVTGKEVFAWDAPIRVASTAKKTSVPKGGGPPQEAPEGPPWYSFSMSPDGKTAAYILSADDGSQRVAARIVVCDGRTGKLLHRLDDSGQRGPMLDKTLFSPDGRLLATTSRNVTHLWNAATGVKVRTFTGHRGDIEALAFSKSGQRLATASADSTVLIWDIGTLSR